jgi:hypothetical protein
MQENAIFTITPPDMQLSDGPTITVVSTSADFVASVEAAHERLFKTVPVTIYNAGAQIDESNIAWLVSVMRLSDNIFIDLDTANDLGVLCGIFSQCDIVFINKEKRRNDIAKLINCMKTDYQVYEELEDYLEVILSQFS